MLLVAAVATPALADRRTFVRAYEYATQPQGNLEVEIWNDVDSPKAPFSVADSLITQRLELEYGLTDHWDVALYHVFEQGSPDRTPFHFASWRLETRYRFAEKNVWPVDVEVYLEGERPAALDEPFELEEKLILEKDFGRFALVANLVGEQKLARGDRRGHLWEVDLGARLEVTPRLRLAAEYWNIQESAGSGPVVKNSSYFGPSFSVAADRFWLQAGVGFGLGSTETAFQFRSVLGFNL
jgi:hypothetical protein